MKLLEALEAASEADLAEVTAEIAVAEKRLDSLKAVQKLLRARLGVNVCLPASGPPANGHASNGKTNAQGSGLAARLNQSMLCVERQKRAVAVIAKEGPQKIMHLAAAIDCPSGSIHKVIGHAWFQREGDGRIAITNAARNEVLGMKEDE